MFRKSKSIKTESKLVVAWGWEREQGLSASGHKGSRWADGNVLKLGCDDDYTRTNLLKMF